MRLTFRIRSYARADKPSRVIARSQHLLKIGIAYAASGNKEDARKVLHEMIESSKRKRAPQHSYRIARIYAALLERDAAFRWLETAFNEREENLVWLKVDPHLDYLRPDPRFTDLMRRVGFAPEGPQN